MKPLSVVITCEHASNYVPKFYGHLFDSAQDDLNSHLGWDPNSMELAQFLAFELQVELLQYEHSRLLIEVNRSLDHPHLFSKYTNGLNETDKNLIINTYYLPYRDMVENHIGELVRAGNQAVHIGVHTFTPEFFGVKRSVELGLLFDPDRPSELSFNTEWMRSMQAMDHQTVIRPNEPYAGKDDGFVTYLRTKFSDEHYIGIELEVSQKFDKYDQHLYMLLLDGLKQALSHCSETDP